MFYRNREGLKAAGAKIGYTEEQIREYMKCAEDPIYFIEKYINILDADTRDIIPFKMFDYQKEIILALHHGRFVCVNLARRGGKTVTVSAYCVWAVTFNNNYSIGIFADKAKTAGENMEQIQFMYEHLPIWLQQGVDGNWNVFSFTLENGSRVMAETTTKKSSRGFRFDLCITGEATVTIRDKLTGEIKDVTLEELYALAQHSRFEVLTSEGFKDFQGVSCRETDQTLTFKLSNTSISCTPEHPLWIGDAWKRADQITINDKLFDINKNPIEILSIIREHKKQLVYDLVNVQDTQSFIANGLIVHNCFLDEFAHVENNIADQFFGSVYPTITRSKFSKLAVVSTPNGLNHFHKIYQDGIDKKNPFKCITAPWDIVPGRDQKFKDETISIIGPARWNQEFECIFLEKTGALLDANAMMKMNQMYPTKELDDVKFYDLPQKDHKYIITVDAAEGKSQDYHAFIVFDITEFPFKVAATFRNNQISAMLLPTKVHQIAKMYNTAVVLIETRSLGRQVADIMFYDLEYENLLFSSPAGRAGQRLGHSGPEPGIATSVLTKKVGCSALKNLIEEGQLVTNDMELFKEFTTFTFQGSSYKAERGYHDDLVMCCVIFAWATTEDYFSDLNNSDIRTKLYSDHMKQIEEDFLPFNIDLGLPDDGSVETDKTSEFYGWEKSKTRFKF